MSVEIRPAAHEDVPAVVAMVHEFAEYERAAEECHLTTEQLREALFDHRRRSSATSRWTTTSRSGWRCGSSTSPPGPACTASTWRTSTCAGRPGHRRREGARRGPRRDLRGAGYPRLEWWMLDWNPARAFYDAIGAGRRRSGCRTGCGRRADDTRVDGVRPP